MHIHIYVVRVCVCVCMRMRMWYRRQERHPKRHHLQHAAIHPVIAGGN